MKAIKINKRQARTLLGALDWCECDFRLGKSQKDIRAKIYEKFPDLKPNPANNLFTAIEKQFGKAMTREA